MIIRAFQVPANYTLVSGGGALEEAQDVERLFPVCWQHNFLSLSLQARVFW